MTDVTKMSDEELIAEAQRRFGSEVRRTGWAVDAKSNSEIVADLASRLEAALEREREDVKALQWIHDNWGCRSDQRAAFKRLAAREKKG